MHRLKQGADLIFAAVWWEPVEILSEVIVIGSYLEASRGFRQLWCDIFVDRGVSVCQFECVSTEEILVFLLILRDSGILTELESL